MSAAFAVGAPSMRQVARALLEVGKTQEEAVKILREEFPGLDLTDGPEWRRDAPYQNVVATEAMARTRRGRGRGRD